MSNATDRPPCPAFEQEAVPGVRLGGRAEPRELSHRPQAAPIHRRVDAARERVLARRPELRARRRSPTGPPPCRAASGVRPTASGPRPVPSGRRLRVHAGRPSVSLSAVSGISRSPASRRPRIAAARYGSIRLVQQALDQLRVVRRGPPALARACPPGRGPPPPEGAGRAAAARGRSRRPDARDGHRSHPRARPRLRPIAATVRTTGGVHPRSGPIRSICSRSRAAASAPSRSALFTTNTSATSRMPAFATCTASPQPGDDDDQGRIGRGGDVHLGLSHAHGLDDHQVATGGVEDPNGLGCRERHPAEVTARGHRADEDLRVRGVRLHPQSVAEERAAGERRRRDRSRGPRPNARCSRATRTSSPARVDFPTPGAPVRPTV